MAEALSIKEALSWAKEMKLDNFILETDALKVVQFIRNPAVTSPVGILVSDCVSLLKFFNNVVVTHVCRSANGAAHSCARVAHYVPGVRGWSSIPSFLLHVISLDCSL